LEDITEDERLLHNMLLAARGNHKNTVVNADFMRKVLEAEVAHGWLIPLPNDAHLHLLAALLGPVGLVFQGTINEKGERERERRRRRRREKN